MRWMAMFPLLFALGGCTTYVVDYQEVVAPPMYGQATVVDTTPVDVTTTTVYYY